MDNCVCKAETLTRLSSNMLQTIFCDCDHSQLAWVNHKGHFAIKIHCLLTCWILVVVVTACGMIRLFFGVPFVLFYSLGPQWQLLWPILHVHCVRCGRLWANMKQTTKTRETVQWGFITQIESRVERCSGKPWPTNYLIQWTSNGSNHNICHVHSHPHVRGFVLAISANKGFRLR